MKTSDLDMMRSEWFIYKGIEPELSLRERSTAIHFLLPLLPGIVSGTTFFRSATLSQMRFNADGMGNTKPEDT